MDKLDAITVVLAVWLYVIIGVWVCYKRKWYSYLTSDERGPAIIFGIALMPFNFLIAFAKEFLWRDWDNG